MPRASSIVALLVGIVVACVLLADAPSARLAIQSAPASQLNAPLTSPAAPNPQSPFGIAGVMRWPDWGTFGRPADAMLQTGGAWVREDFAWGLIEPHPGNFDWTATDRIAGALADRKINVLGILAYSASWATSTTDDDSNPISFYPPDLTLYYNFVKTLVGHYKGSIHYWEVWNEPDNPIFWKPAPNPQQYAALLQTAYKAVKDADPTARVLTGGVSGNAIPYLEAVMAAGAGNSFDILALHPYAVPPDPAQGRLQSSPDVHKILDVEMNKYRAFLQRHNLDHPIWVTEVGWPANSWALTPDQQATFLAQTYALLLSSGIPERIFWYSFKDESAGAADSWGLISWGNGPTDLSQTRPSFNAYRTSANLLTGTAPAGRLQLGPFDIIEPFEQPATWSRSTGDQGTFTVTTERSHGGSSSGKLQYSFTAPSQAVDFAPPQPEPLPGTPTRLGLWVLGDGSGDYLSAWIKDRNGQLFKVRLGAVTGPSDGWRYFESSIDGYYFDWEKTGGSAASADPVYPVSFVSFRLENTPDEPAGSGTIYVDDLQSWNGPDVNAVRFSRTDGSVVDVLWSDSPTQANLPTSSAQAQVISRDGAASTVAAQGGALSLKVTDSPIYVLHKPASTGTTAMVVSVSGPQSGSGADSEGNFSTVCMAAVQANNNNQNGNLYFAQTGHNLSGLFRTYWETHGGVDLLGYPITEEFNAPLADGKVYRQQFFERARLEYHPENQPPEEVQLGLLGVWATRGRDFPRVDQAHAPSGSLFFPQTGETLLTFKDWWNTHDGLSTFGLPISPEILERNAADGKVYDVQYFERNRLEYHPDNKGTPAEVTLGLLGTEYLKSAAGCQ